MLILLFMLKEAVVMLRAESMDIRDVADVSKLLSEDSESGRKRLELHQRMERLRMAQERITINIMWNVEFFLLSKNIHEGELISSYKMA